jgi:hypothetical protein
MKAQVTAGWSFLAFFRTFKIVRIFAVPETAASQYIMDFQRGGTKLTDYGL